MGHIFRCQNELLALNDDVFLENVLSDIYHDEMVINTTNISRCKCNFLDLTINIYKGKCSIKLYDKKITIFFEVINNYPFLDGNIPKIQDHMDFL